MPGPRFLRTEDGTDTGERAGELGSCPDSQGRGLKLVWGLSCPPEMADRREGRCDQLQSVIQSTTHSTALSSPYLKTLSWWPRWRWVHRW